MNLTDLITPESIRIPLHATDKRSAIAELVDVLAEAHGLTTGAEELKAAVLEREQQRSTGIGEGLAIPHGKSDTVDRLFMAIGTPSEPMEFEAIDRRPVRMIVLLASPPDRTSDHIQALGKISRLMSRAEFREKAYEADSAQTLYTLFEEAEKALAAKG